MFEEYSAIAGMQYVDGYFYQGELAELDQLTIVDVGACIYLPIDGIRKLPYMACIFLYIPTHLLKLPTSGVHTHLVAIPKKK